MQHLRSFTTKFRNLLWKQRSGKSSVCMEAGSGSARGCFQVMFLFWRLNFLGAPLNIRKLSINSELPNNKLIILKHRQLSTLSYQQNKTRPCVVLWQRGKQNHKLRCLWIEFPPSELFHFLRPDSKRLLLRRFPIFLRPNIISRDESNQNIS